MSLLSQRAGEPEQTPGDDAEFIAVDFVRLFIVLFIVWQLFCVAFWLMPASNIKTPFVPLLQEYMWFVGCDQNWNMFAPQPANQDIYLLAKITYRDGAQMTWTFPRMHDLNYFQRYQEERFRKMIEYAHQDGYNRMWPFLARFAALSNDSSPKTNPVVHVELVRRWQNIPKPGAPMPPYTQYTFYRADFPTGSLNN